MKKTLLLSIAFLSVTLANAQTILTEDASSLTVGNIGTDLTGTTAGQGGWLTTAPNNGNNTDFQVVNVGGVYGNAIQITGSNTNANTRRMFKNVSAAWASRDAGNDVAQVQFDLFTGAATTSANSFRVILYNEDNTRALAGFSYVAETRALSGLSFFDNSGSPGGVMGNYLFFLSFNGTQYSNVILAPNTWYTLGASFNKGTGEVVFKELSGALITSSPVNGAAGGSDVASVNLVISAISTTGQANTTAGVAVIDNINFRAVAEDSPQLKITTPVAAADFSTYPNPAENVVNISTVGQIKSVSIADMNGRIVKNQAVGVADETQINVSDLNTGVYFMTVQGEAGSVTKKIVKQ